MRKLLHFTLLLFWINGLQAQRLKHSRAYVAGILQEGRFGGSLILSYGINQYLGVGAGVDITSYRGTMDEDARFFAPFYADLRLKYPTKFVEPFIFGQFGKPAYRSKTDNFTDITGTPTSKLREEGKYFYGAGAGLSSKPGGKVGAFASVTYRMYQFGFNPSNPDINGRIIEDRDQSMLVISAGLVF